MTRYAQEDSSTHKTHAFFFPRRNGSTLTSISPLLSLPFLTQLFVKWDQDKSGSLDMKEVEKAIRKPASHSSRCV